MFVRVICANARTLYAIKQKPIKMRTIKSLSCAICTILFSVTLCNAQTTYKPNAFSFELGKTGLIYNLTFDRKAEATNFGFRLGFGSNFAKYLNAITAGAGGYYLIGNTNRFFELGADFQYLVVDEVSDDQKGFSLIYPDYSVKTFYPSLNLGYRAYSKRTLFRIGLSPGVIDNDFVPGGYISLGLRF